MMEKEATLLRDLWETYTLQMDAMVKAISRGKTLKATLHKKVAEQVIDAYFDTIERVVDE